MKSRVNKAPEGYDLIVVGAGIAGCEVAVSLARAGKDVLLVTTSLDTIYNLAAPKATLKPPQGSLMDELLSASGAPEIDNFTLHRLAKAAVEREGKIHFLQSSVSALRLDGECVVGIDTWEGVPRYAGKTILCVGSFLRARLKIGSLEEHAGRLSEMAYDALYDDLERLGFCFADLRLEVAARQDGLPYEVLTKRFAATEWEPETCALPRLKNLYAAGVCAAGYLSYEDAATAGLRAAAGLRDFI